MSEALGAWLSRNMNGGNKPHFLKNNCASICIHYIFLQWGVQIHVCCGNKECFQILGVPSPNSRTVRVYHINPTVFLVWRGRCCLCSPSTARETRTPAEWGRPGERTAIWDCAHSVSSGPWGGMWSGTARDGGMWESVWPGRLKII